MIFLHSDNARKIQGPVASYGVPQEKQSAILTLPCIYGRKLTSLPETLRVLDKKQNPKWRLPVYLAYENKKDVFVFNKFHAYFVCFQYQQYLNIQVDKTLVQKNWIFAWILCLNSLQSRFQIWATGRGGERRGQPSRQNKNLNGWC